MVIGIIGGTGEIGSKVVDYLLENTSYDIIIGARNTPSVSKSARCIFYKVNYTDKCSVDNFCKKCSVVINTIGPSFKVKDNIAISALHNNCDYVDIGGYYMLYNILKEYEKDFLNKEISAIIGNGWMPGISGVMALYTIQNVLQTYKCNPDDISVRIFYGAVEKWSYNSCYDIARSTKDDLSFVLINGEKKRGNTLNKIVWKKIPNLKGLKMCAVHFNDELSTYSKLNNIQQIESFVILGDIKSFFYYVFPHRTLNSKAKAIKKDFIRLHRKQGSWGTVYIEIKNNKTGCLINKNQLFTCENIKATYLSIIITIKAILEKKIKKGVGYTCDMVDIEWYINELKKSGIVLQTNNQHL